MIRKISVNIKELSIYHYEISSIAEEVHDEIYDMNVELDIPDSGEKLFNERLANLISEHFASCKDLHKKINCELIMFYDLFRYIGDPFLNELDKSKFSDWQKFIKLIKSKTIIAKNDRVEIRITSGKQKKTFELPDFDDIETVYKKLVDCLTEYTRKNGSENWKLNTLLINNDFDNPLGSMASKLQSLEKTLVPKADVVKFMAYYSLILLPFLSFEPNLAPSNRKNSILSLSQSKFFLDYFYLFGIDNGTYKINLKNNIIDAMSFRKSLRHAIVTIKKSYDYIPFGQNS